MEYNKVYYDFFESMVNFFCDNFEYLKLLQTTQCVDEKDCDKLRYINDRLNEIAECNDINLTTIKDKFEDEDVDIASSIMAVNYLNSNFFERFGDRLIIKDWGVPAVPISQTIH